MTAQHVDKRTRSFDEGQNEAHSSDFVADGSDPQLHEIPAASVQNLTMDAEVMPMAMQRALRAARTPLIPGVDFKPAAPAHDATMPDSARSEAASSERSRVDTLSPTESVPPPAPYPLEPRPARPSIVPPVRLPYGESYAVRTRSEPPATGLRSDPPPRIPISDRPSRPAYRSDPPPRVSRSEPPPQSSRRGPALHRRSWDDAGYGMVDSVAVSADARRREAETIPADARSPSHPDAYDPSVPLPALRAPSFSLNQLPNSARQHENSRLRNVSMTMMFVFFIVTGAIAGMRWYVAREDGNVAQPTETTAEATRVSPTLRLDRLQPNALVAPPSGASTMNVKDVLGAATMRAASPVTGGQATSRRPAGPAPVATSAVIDTTRINSPWSANDGRTSNGELVKANAAKSQDARAASSTSSRAASRPKRRTTSVATDSKRIDTKTPLIQD